MGSSGFELNTAAVHVNVPHTYAYMIHVCKYPGTTYIFIAILFRQLSRTRLKFDDVILSKRAIPGSSVQ